ncbi:MAG TPA: D-xylose ABC transporter ATP-binding protein [Anaerolineaceae bacterium]|nr:D-xylose ABC transporter ATP-binding protein [Anaerolineaceae bacterium]
MTTILSLKNISRSFPGVQALDDISLEVEQGTIHALVGANGAGKSTLMKILSGALAPDSGEMIFENAPYAPADPSAAIKDGIATIYQELNLLPTRTVTANINVGKEPNHFGILDEKTERQKAASALAQLNASYIPLQALVGNLKVGEKQIIEIAKALVGKCKLLILDEPTAALNDSEIIPLFNIIKDLKNQGVTILYVSHRLKEIFALADVVTVLCDGKLVVTSLINQVTPDILINHMTGRKKIKSAFPEKNKVIKEEVLRLEHLSSSMVFKDINLSIHRGEVIGITGLAGSGKVELGKALIGDFPINSGQVFLQGIPFKPSPAKAKSAHIGYMPEDRKKEGVLEELSVQRNISLPSLSDLTQFPGFILFNKERELAQQGVEELDIKTPSLKQIVRNLSGGNQQKVSLAKWLATNSEILLLIEPTQGIDVGVKFEIYELIHKLSAQGKTIILVSSEISEIIGLAHSIVVLFNGQIQAILDGNQTNEEEVLQATFGK